MAALMLIFPPFFVVLKTSVAKDFKDVFRNYGNICYLLGLFVKWLCVFKIIVYKFPPSLISELFILSSNFLRQFILLSQIFYILLFHIFLKSS